MLQMPDIYRLKEKMDINLEINFLWQINNQIQLSLSNGHTVNTETK